MLTTKQQELIALLRGTLNSAPEEVAKENISWYPIWVAGEPLNIGDRRAYKDVLYEVYNSVGDNLYSPDQVPAIFKAIGQGQSGTYDDPIPAVAGMEYIKGKYYLEGDKKYLMNRAGMEIGEGVILQYLPSQLVGLYFEEVA